MPSLNEGLVHIHGLGVNPSDGALYIATHGNVANVSRRL
jgi:hypothetical protein